MKLIPKNKKMIIEPTGASDKIGSGMLFAAGTTVSQYRTGKIVTLDDSPEAAGYSVGQVVLYDIYGAVEHTLGQKKFTVVPYLNVQVVVSEDE